MADTNKVFSLDKLVSVYIKLRDQKAELAAQFTVQEEDLDKKLKVIQTALLDHCKESGSESVRTASGTFFRSVRKKFWTGDWDSMNKFILEHDALGLLEKRIHQTNMRTFLEDNPTLLPPGLNVDSEYTITVRRK